MNDRTERDVAPVGAVELRDVVPDDIPVFFEHQLDAEANHMAAFTAEDPADRRAFVEHWTSVLRDPAIVKRTVLCDGRVAGHIVSFSRLGKPEIGYWIGRDFWGRGVATRALRTLLGHVTARPVYARAAKDNAGSLRVLQKCGFTIVGDDRGFSNVRGYDVEEFVLELRA